MVRSRPRRRERSSGSGSARGRSASLVARTRDVPAATLRALRDTVARLDPELPVDEETMAEHLNHKADGGRAPPLAPTRRSA